MIFTPQLHKPEKSPSAIVSPS